MKDIRESIIRMKQLKYTDFGGMLITPENVKLTFNNEITLDQAEEILVSF